MMDSPSIRKSVVAALLGQEKPRSKRGRPKNRELGGIDTHRAALVIWAFAEFPTIRTRREAISLLQGLCVSANIVGENLASKGFDFDAKNLSKAALTFPMRDLEQSVSRGMNANGGLLREVEKLVKKSRLFFNK